VQGKLDSMSGLSDSNINVSVSGGVVTLSGNAASADDKVQAEAAAKSVKGVKSVDNQLSTNGSDTGASSSGGRYRVAANGSTPSPSNATYGSPSSSTMGSAGDMSGQSSSSMSGGMGTSGTVVSDADLTAKVKAKLAGMSNLSNSNIVVSAKEGKVTLSGKVDSSSAEDAAKSAAKSVPGVRKVDSDLHVDKDLKDKSGSSYTGSEHPVSDSWITTKVKSELLADNMTKGFDVKVTTTNGVVVLSGNLPSEAAISHAKAVAEKVDGVKSVDTSGLDASGK
jgi:hyperosmotically inducible protein